MVFNSNGAINELTFRHTVVPTHFLCNLEGLHETKFIPLDMCPFGCNTLAS